MLSKKKCIVLICAAVLTLSACTACGGSSSSGDGGSTASTAQASKTAAQISKEVMDSGIEFPEMIEVNADNLKLQYSLEDGDFKEFGVYWSGNAAYADEVCVILAAEGKTDKVKDAVNQRLESQKTAFKDYVAEEYDRLCTTSVNTRGDYVYWVCTKDNAKANDLIAKAIG